MKSIQRFLFVFMMAAGLSACSNTNFESTWHDPSAASINLQNKTVAAFLISGNESVRRSFELNLANQLTERGIETLPGYEVLPNTDVTSKEPVLRELRNSDADIAVFMRIVDREQELTFIPNTTWYPGAYYDPFLWRYGYFYGPGFAGAWPYYDYGYYQMDTIVSVDTMVYSVPDSKLLWAGLSKTMNPSKVEGFVKELVSETVKQLKDAGMVRTT